MKAAFHYIVKAKLVRFINGSNIDFLEFEERFEDESPIIARGNAFNLYQNYIDVLLEGKNKKYHSDRQARQELTSFIDTETGKRNIRLFGKEYEISDSLGNGIGVFMVLDKVKPEGDDSVGDEFFIHGIGSIGLSYQPDSLIFNLNVEFDYYKYFNYDIKDQDIKIIYCDRGEWEDGFRDDEPSEHIILETPFDWNGYENPYWWGEPNDEEHIESDKAPKTFEEIIKGGENNLVEFKPSLLYNFTTEKAGISIKGIIAKAICAFLNSNGGWLFIGINDEGIIQGLDYDYQLAGEKNTKDFFLLEFDQMLEHFLTFSVKSNVSGKFYKIDEKEIFVINVTPNKRRPIFFIDRRDGKKEFYVRGEASSRQITDIEEILNYCIDRSINS